MKYMGSKSRHAKYILPFIYDAVKEINAAAYVEPFVGGGNMIDKVELDIPKIGNDYHYYLIEMFKALQKGWLPPDFVSEDEYKLIKNNKDKYEPALVGYCGFALSFGSRWFGSYAKNSRGDNYSMQGKNSIVKQVPKIMDVLFINKSFIDLDIPEFSVIYCDPPYKDTAKYSLGNFDHDTFWDWAKIMVEIGHKVFVSEYNAPPEWKCLCEIQTVCSLPKNINNKIAVEKLFTLN